MTNKSLTARTMDHQAWKPLISMVPAVAKLGDFFREDWRLETPGEIVLSWSWTMVDRNLIFSVTW